MINTLENSEVNLPYYYLYRRILFQVLLESEIKLNKTMMLLSKSTHY